jgi:hypothetical protein
MSEEFGFRAIINTSDAETIKAIDGISNAFNNEAYDTLQEVLGSFELETQKIIDTITSCFSSYSDYASSFKDNVVQLLIDTAKDNSVSMETEKDDDEITINILGHEGCGDDFGAAFFGVLSGLNYDSLSGMTGTMGLLCKYTMQGDSVSAEINEREY